MPLGPRVVVPYSDLAEIAGDGWPFGLRVDVWNGGDAPPEQLDDVALFVLPYGQPGAYAPLKQLTNVQVVQSLRAGVDELLPLVAANVTVANGRGLHDASTAEHALALTLAAERQLPRWFQQQAAGTWKHEFVTGLADRSVLLVGYGAIGQAIERRLLACDARVTRVAHRPRPAEGVHGVEDLDGLLPDAEIVVLVLPDTETTRGLMDARRLGLLPDDALVVNVGRGTAIETDALVAELGARRLRAALDVVTPEPLPAGHPLWSVPGLLLTPHVGGGSADMLPRARRLIAEQLRRFAQGEPLQNVIRQA